MNLTFPRLFESLNYCRDSTTILIDLKSKAYPIQAQDHWLYGKRSLRYFTPTVEQTAVDHRKNHKTIRAFVSLIQNFVGEHKHSPEIVELIRSLRHLREENLPLTAKKVRSAYRVCVAAKLTDYRKIAALGRDTDRIISSSDDQGGRFKVHNVGLEWFNDAVYEENKQATTDLKEILTKEWGAKRLKRAEERRGIDLDARIRDGTTLRVSDINQLMLGLADYYFEDLSKCWKTLQTIREDASKVAELPGRTLRRLCKEWAIDPSNTHEISEQAKARLQAVSFNKIDKETFALLQRVVLLDAEELELAMHGRWLEGVVDGLQTHMSAYFIRNIDLEDQERLQMYHTILTAHERMDEEQFEPFFDEILTKGLVKKDIQEGMLIPAPWKDPIEDKSSHRFYAILKKMRTGMAKLGYFLTGAGPVRQKDILMYRSTASAPSSIDSLTTLITDLFPFDPPAYFWRYAGDEAEKRILNHSRTKPLRIIGHSLGGSHAQLLLLNQIAKKELGFEHNLPVKNYEIVTFDSPKIKLQCVEVFAEWLQSESASNLLRRISITHYTSKHDPVPFAGEALLGAQADETKLKELKVVKLTPKVTDHPMLSYHPHGRHFFRTRLNSDFVEEAVDIDTTTCRKWHIIEVVRRIVGFILFPILWLYNEIKNLIFGIGHHLDAEISKVWEKFYPQEALPGTTV
ncbi:lipase family protein [Estrella lausannensis]|uniref:Putative lipase n=1 Tax=Estrella lausannensis TaxID=483423 RepID=A0A0H5DR04_9BACT|nr:hypothetical protein [Estrella lausannensis]CRX38059.1 Putative lipase [Estrella lausannensis]